MYQLSNLAKVPGLVHGFSTREEGNQGFGFVDGIGYVIRNRGIFLRKLHGSFHIRAGVGMVPFKPGYEDTIILVAASQAGEGMVGPNAGPKGEALILGSEVAPPLRPIGDSEPWDGTTPPLFEGVNYLFLSVADCIPIILYDPVKRVLALVHASRKSTVSGVTYQTVECMKRHFGVKPDDLIAGLGPGVKTYDLERFALAEDPGWRPFVDKLAGGKVRIDLFGHNVHLLKRAGIPENKIEVSPVDTFTDVRFFSHRRSKATGEPEGRHACCVGMVPLE